MTSVNQAFDEEGDVGQLLYRAAKGAKEKFTSISSVSTIVLGIVVSCLIVEVLYLHHRLGKVSSGGGGVATADCAMMNVMVKQECFAAAVANKARRQPPSGSTEVELDVRQYGKKKVPGIVPRQAVPSIVIVTSCVGVDYCEASERNFKQYAECHGYELDFNKQQLAAGRSAHWTKIPLIQKHLLKGADYVFWMDADSLFMEQSLSIETLIATNPTSSLFLEADLNTGHFIFKNTPWSHAFLKEWYSTYPSPLPWNDQSSLMYILGGRRPECRQSLVEGGLDCYAVVAKEFRDGSKDNSKQRKDIVTLLDRRIMSSYFWEYQIGDYIVHFPGMEHAKFDMMRKFAKSATMSGLQIFCE